MENNQLARRVQYVTVKRFNILDHIPNWFKQKVADKYLENTASALEKYYSN